MGSKRRVGFIVIAIALAISVYIFLKPPPPSGSRIVILKYTTHPALDELEKSFIERLNSNVKGNPALANIEIEQYNAGGNQQRAMEYARIATDPKVKLILAIGTPAAQAVSKTDSSIPLLYGAVANPKDAGLIPSARATGIQNASPQVTNRLWRSFTPCFLRLRASVRYTTRRSRIPWEYRNSFRLPAMPGTSN